MSGWGKWSKSVNANASSKEETGKENGSPIKPNRDRWSISEHTSTV